MTRNRAQTLLLLFISLFLPLLVVAQDGEPKHKINYFHNLPGRLFFFDDTTVAIYFDFVLGDIYVSEDEGFSWNRAADIPKGEVQMVYEHPFNNRYAFVLTKGNKHYRTDDRGKTWRPFEMPIPPAFTQQPLSFHSDRSKSGYILYQGKTCDRTERGANCYDETYYTKDAFSDTPKMLLSQVSRCQFAHSSPDFKHSAHPDLIYCVAFDTKSTTGSHALSSSRLFSSTDFFEKDNKVEDLGIGRNARGVVAFAIVGKFAVVALKDLTPSNDGEMLLYVTFDTKTWAKAHFPHASSARLRENAYTIVESTKHSLAIDVLLQDKSSIGTLFVSDSNGTYFVESLKDTNRNEYGFVDFENIYGIDGVGLANVVANAELVEGRGSPKKLNSVITFDDGRSWAPISAPSTDAEGKTVHCNTAHVKDCSLHLHSVTTPHNFGRTFSSPAPGFVMGVGTIGKHLNPYEESDTFLSIDAGLNWKMVQKNAHLYEFGDQGSVIIIVNNEEPVDSVMYSTDMGTSWRTYKLALKIRARALTTISDSTSQKFLLLGQLSRKQHTDQGRYVVIQLDFSATRKRQCAEADFERWYARTTKHACLLGHRQWYLRRKPDANCYVGKKFEDPVEHEEICPCEEEDYECDYNYVRSGSECTPIGPEPIPAGVCNGTPGQTYMGSSGYRRIPGDTCDRELGLKKDEPKAKPCSQAQPAEGEVTHQIFEFDAQIVQHAYFKKSTTILVRLADHSIWQSSNEGYTWMRLFPDEHFLAFYHHSYSDDRAYLITTTNKYYYTTDAGRDWNPMEAPTVPNTFGAQVLSFHPETDYLIWTGNVGCTGTGENCHAEAHYSRNNGRKWTLVEKYVQNCQWARDSELLVDPTQILCESYRDKNGSQRDFKRDNPLQLVGGTGFYEKKTKLFEHVVGFAKFSEFLVVAEFLPARGSLDLQVSLDGRTFATGQFPPSMHPETHAYTILESSTKAVFLHMTMTDNDQPPWGNILKSNSNGTYFGLSLAYANRNDRGYVDFEKMIGLDGIAIANVVSNPQDAPLSGNKILESRITHNDGGTWERITPPKVDSQRQPYECNHAKCSLHVHGYTERYDARATYSSPSIVGVLLAVGNVAERLAPYVESDTFLSRNGGFTWEEVHKDAHLWEFGDSGSILVMANDEAPTDHVLFSTDEGLTWREYTFGSQKIRVRSIVTVPSDTSRRFILMGNYPRSAASVVVHLDFTSLTDKKCVLDLENPGHDDFELWSPSEERPERCLFGRQTLYHRRVRNTTCVVGNQEKATEKIVKNCPCSKVDFECEFNYVRDPDSGECVLVPGTAPLRDDDSCRHDEEYWYGRTAYRKIPYSTCEDGIRPDRGDPHRCPGFGGHGFFFWFTVLVMPFIFTALVGYWYYRRSGLTRGTIRLPGDGISPYNGDNDFMSTLASIPWYLIGLGSIAWEYLSSSLDPVLSMFRSRRGYRDIPVDEDAQILRFEDEEE